MDKELTFCSVLLLCIMLLLLVFAVYFCVDWVMEFYDFKYSTPNPTTGEALAFTFTYFFQTIGFYIIEALIAIFGIILACINRKIAQGRFVEVATKIFFAIFLLILLGIAALILISFLKSLF